MAPAATAAALSSTTGRVKVLIVGAGPVGLINARTLLEDGVFDVTIVARSNGLPSDEQEDRVGGNWAYTYPDLRTNNPWGALTFSGLDMPKPKNMPGHSIPAETYRRYLEDFYRYFIQDKATILLSTEVVDLAPLDDSARGWRATFRRNDGEAKEEVFDKVVLATGKPEIPQCLQNGSLPVFHTSDLGSPEVWDRLLSLAPLATGEAKPNGDGGRICVVGGGKSATDIAAALANRGRKVVIVMRGAKWHLPLVEHPPTPLREAEDSMMEVMFGPPLVMDSLMMRFYHCTSLGAGIVKKFWDGMIGLTKGVLYDERVPAPDEDLYTSLPYFSGGIGVESTDFRALVNDGKIEVVRGSVTGTNAEGVIVKTSIGEQIVACKAIVVGTGWSSRIWDFLDAKLQYSLGLTPRPQPAGFEERVRRIRKRWSSISGTEVGDVPMPLVYRGLLPLGRWKQRDLVVAGATRPFLLPVRVTSQDNHISILKRQAAVYEVESHWTASLFNPSQTRQPKLPSTAEEVEEACHEQNEYLLARYPTLDPLKATIYSTFFTGFSDPAYTRLLLRDIGVYPWRQAGKRWWHWWSWFITPFNAEQYAAIGEERRARW